MEKRGDISEETPGCCGKRCGCRTDGQPMSKEAADEIQESPLNDAIDAVASQTEKNAKAE